MLGGLHHRYVRIAPSPSSTVGEKLRFFLFLFGLLFCWLGVFWVDTAAGVNIYFREQVRVLVEQYEATVSFDMPKSAV